MNKRGMLIVFSGPSGCGKGTVLKALFSRRDDICYSVSVTTRAPRPGETDGVEYFFRTRKQVEEMIAKNELFEYAVYNGNYYGTPKPPIEAWLAAGKHVLLEIEVQGAEKVMAQAKDCVSISSPRRRTRCWSSVCAAGEPKTKRSSRAGLQPQSVSLRRRNSINMWCSMMRSRRRLTVLRRSLRRSRCGTTA